VIFFHLIIHILKLLYVPVYFTHFSIVANQFSVLNCAFFIVVFIVFYISAYFLFKIRFARYF